VKKILFSSLLVASSIFASTLATVNGEKITEEDVNAFLAPIARGATFDVLPADAKEKLLNQMIEKKLLTKEAKKDGIEKTKEFKETISKLSDDIALELWMKKAFEEIKISDKDVKKYYDDNKEVEFKEEESVKARHILLKDEATTKQLIAELQKSKNLKDDFIAMAKEKSTGPSSSNGGDLGFFNKKQMVPEFSDAAFKLKVGEITTTPVKSQFGYHIIYLEDKKEAGYMAFEDVKDKIASSMKMEKFKDNTSKMAKELKSKAKVEINLEEKK
jgi:parvulin-like peptidyl-prolyl isomerase